MTVPHRVDVVVVGAGNAALTAAISAREAGADVLVLERAPEPLRGGNTRFTGGIFRFSYPTLAALNGLLEGDEDVSDVVVEPYSSELYMDDLERLSKGRHDRELSRTLVERSYDTVQWLHGLGVGWEFARTAVEARSADGAKLGLQLGAAVRTRGKGPALSETLFARALEAGVDVLYSTEACGLRVDGSGALAAVEIREQGEAGSVECGAAVLACGGFESSASLRGQYLGQGWERVKVRGTRFNTGEMLLAALRAGAAPAGDWSECHATPIGADSPDFGDLDLGAATNRLSYPYGVMVNLRGERFADEGEDFKLYTYAKMGTEIMRQPHGLAFQLFDARATDLLEERYRHTEPIRAQTIGELAAELERAYASLGLRAGAVQTAVEGYNDSVGAGAFDPLTLDGLRTSGLVPEKTNWARPLDTAPFSAYPVTAGITFTFGGVAVGPDAAVRRAGGDLLPGLFATGEITGGFFYENYPAGAGLMRGAVFGRLAGEGAARLARGR
jgi:tricarballylate dehydrogenase